MPAIISSGAQKKIFKGWNSRQVNSPDPNPSNPPAFRMSNAPAKGEGIATQVRARLELLLPGEPCAVDIEFEQFRVKGEVHQSGPKAGKVLWKQRLAWIAIVNSRLEVVFDAFVLYPKDHNIISLIPRAPGKDFGVTKERLMAINGSVTAACAEKRCEEIFADRPVVVHGGAGDKSAFQLRDPFAGASAEYDTQEEWAGDEAIGFESKPGLKTLAAKLLGIQIQKEGNHGPVEDATTTMKIHLIKYPYNRQEEAAKWQPIWQPVEDKKAKKVKGTGEKTTHYSGKSYTTGSHTQNFNFGDHGRVTIQNTYNNYHTAPPGSQGSGQAGGGTRGGGGRGCGGRGSRGGQSGRN